MDPKTGPQAIHLTNQEVNPLMPLIKNGRKGISDVVATVIIVAATVAVALVAVSYFTGVIGSSTNTERFQVISAAIYIKNNTNNTCLVLHVKNDGKSPVTINGIEIDGVPVAQQQTTLNPGEYKRITLSFTSPSVDSGAVYSVKLITSSGFSYSVEATAKTVSSSPCQTQATQS